jgi:hypothetical protein
MPPAPCSKDQLGGLWTGIRPVHIAVASTMVSDYTGMMVQPHKVGAWACIFSTWRLAFWRPGCVQGAQCSVCLPC